MSNPYYKEQDKLKYWMNKHNAEFERANGLEMDLVHAEYRIRELQVRLSDLIFENENLKARDRIENVVEEVLGKMEVSNDKY